MLGEFKRILVAVVYLFCNYAYANESGEPCGQQELVHCSKQIKALAETSEFNFIINKKELEKLCPDLHRGLECIRSYTRRCMNQHQRSHFNKLYYGTNEMISELCKEGTFQEAYLKHAPCMKKVKNEYDVCAQNYKSIMQRLQSGGVGGGSEVSTTTTTTTTTTMASTTMPRIMQINLMKRQQELYSGYVSLETTSLAPLKKNSTDSIADHGEHQIEQTICCAFRKYIECSENVIERACGSESAEFTRIFLDKMLSSLMKMHCEKENHHCEKFASLNHASNHINLHLLLQFIIVIVSFA